MQECVPALLSRIMNVLIALVILSAASGITIAKRTTCQHSIHCPCGSTKKSVTTCVQEERNDNNCRKWSKCKTCKDGLNRCLECPEGLEGPLCATATKRERFYRQKRNSHSHHSHHSHFHSHPHSHFHSHPDSHSPPHLHYELLPRMSNSHYQESPKQEDTSPVHRGGARRLAFCRDPGVDPNGSRNPLSPANRQGFPQGTLLEYSCNRDYDLEGEKNLICLISGKWSSESPMCNSREVARDTSLNFCRDPGMDLNGGRYPLAASSSRGFPQGTRLQYSCKPGYELEGESRIFCLTSGEWTSGIPKCNSRPRGSRGSDTRLTFCRDPGVDPNGIRNPRSQPSRRGFPQGTLLEYSCKPGYVLDGETTIHCLVSGEWSSERARCRDEPPGSGLERMGYPTYCDNPGSILHGKVTSARSLESGVLNGRRTEVPLDDDTKESVAYPEGSNLMYSCDNGYTLNGETNVTCQASGQWSAEPPTCITSDIRHRMYCLNPGPVLNGKIRISSSLVTARTLSTNSVSEDSPEFPEGTKLAYDCDDGYLLEGAQSLNCLSSAIWTALPPKCVSDCGRSIKNVYLKTHDTKTEAGDWPWVVAIMAREGNRNQFLCGGAVLNSQLVLTAAHCVMQHKQFTLYFGKHNYKNIPDTNVLVRTSEKVIIHRNFKNTSLDADIALIKFKPRIKFSERIQPICLPTAASTARNIVPERIGSVAGWGFTEKQLPPEVMRVVHLPVRSNDDCLDSFRQIVPNFTRADFTQNMFCAGYEDARQFTCVGDGGSPMVFYDREKERYVMEGLVSFGAAGQCGIPGRYTVFTNVNPFLPWIFKNM